MKMDSKRRELLIIIFWSVMGVSGFIVIVLLRLGVIGPDGRYYRGDYPELYTVAINSILGSRGYRQYSLPTPVILHVIDVDAYGRALFFYTELYFRSEENARISAYSLVISQGSDGEYVYFYPHYNFISVGQMIHTQRYFSAVDTSQLVADFTAEAIAELKERNSWNQALNLDNAVRVPIVRTKEDRDGPVDREQLLSFYNELHGRESTQWHGGVATFFIADAYGRSIYTFQRGRRRVFVVMFLPDGSFDRNTGVMELPDLQQYQDELKEFMELNDWNQPF